MHIVTQVSICERFGCTAGDYDVTANLLTYFVFLLVLDMVFLIWPIVLSRWEINKDISISISVELGAAGALFVHIHVMISRIHWAILETFCPAR